MSNIFDIQGWSVSVEVDAETILTIGHNSLSGIDDFTDAQAQVIRNCAEHLLAFIGSPRATPIPLADAAAIAEREAEFDRLIRAYGTACHRSVSATEMNETHAKLMNAIRAALATTEAPITDERIIDIAYECDLAPIAPEATCLDFARRILAE